MVTGSRHILVKRRLRDCKGRKTSNSNELREIFVSDSRGRIADMPAPRLPLRLLLPTGLILLVIVLGALQYRWLDQVSQAERAQLQRSLTQRVREFTTDFDRDIELAFSMLAIDFAAMGSPFEALDAHYEAWRTQARFPDVVKAIYLTQAGVDGAPRTLSQLAIGSGSGHAIPWPHSLDTIERTLKRTGSLRRPRSVTVTATEVARPTDTAKETPGQEQALALIIPVIDPPHNDTGGEALILEWQSIDTTAVIVEFDRDVLVTGVLAALVERHFPAADSSPYGIAITDSVGRRLFARGVPDGDDNGSVVHTRFAADVTADFFSAPSLEFGARTATMSHIFALQLNASGPTEQSGTFVRTRSITNGSVDVATGNVAIVVKESNSVLGGLGGWQIALRHSAGSLDAAVEQARQRNLLISFSILSVLAIGVGLVVGNARRSEKLAAQHMDFVATVSHELRTPLAVIRSAAQNLSAGVVADPAQAKRYGELIESEGRRLTDMVEEVLEFAGLSGQRRSLALRPVDPGSLVQDVVEASSTLAVAAHTKTEVTVEAETPMVMGDEESLRRAVSNLLANALKHGSGVSEDRPDGQWVGLSVGRNRKHGRDHVSIAVSDKGRGIDAADLPHIFEPFYRGRHAIDQQIHGNGLGLSLVARIVEAHGGTVAARSTVGEGTTVTIHLPAATAEQAGA